MPEGLDQKTGASLFDDMDAVGMDPLALLLVNPQTLQTLPPSILKPGEIGEPQYQMQGGGGKAATPPAGEAVLEGVPLVHTVDWASWAWEVSGGRVPRHP